MFIDPLEGWENPIEPNKEVANKMNQQNKNLQRWF